MMSEQESKIRDIIERLDFNAFSESPCVSTVVISDPELGLQVKNRIITNELIVRHVLDCRICIEFGLRQCDKLENLQGVWDKIPKMFEKNQGQKVKQK